MWRGLRAGATTCAWSSSVSKASRVLSARPQLQPHDRIGGQRQAQPAQGSVVRPRQWVASGGNGSNVDLPGEQLAQRPRHAVQHGHQRLGVLGLLHQGQAAPGVGVQKAVGRVRGQAMQMVAGRQLRGAGPVPVGVLQLEAVGPGQREATPVGREHLGPTEPIAECHLPQLPLHRWAVVGDVQGDGVEAGAADHPGGVLEQQAVLTAHAVVHRQQQRVGPRHAHRPGLEARPADEGRRHGHRWGAVHPDHSARPAHTGHSAHLARSGHSARPACRPSRPFRLASRCKPRRRR